MFAHTFQHIPAETVREPESNLQPNWNQRVPGKVESKQL